MKCGLSAQERGKMQYVEIGDPDSLRLSCAAQPKVKGVLCEAMYSTRCNSGSRRGKAGVVVSLPVSTPSAVVLYKPF